VTIILPLVDEVMAAGVRHGSDRRRSPMLEAALLRSAVTPSAPTSWSP